MSWDHPDCANIGELMAHLKTRVDGALAAPRAFCSGYSAHLEELEVPFQRIVDGLQADPEQFVRLWATGHDRDTVELAVCMALGMAARRDGSVTVSGVTITDPVVKSFAPGLGLHKGYWPPSGWTNGMFVWSDGGSNWRDPGEIMEVGEPIIYCWQTKVDDDSGRWEWSRSPGIVSRKTKVSVWVRCADLDGEIGPVNRRTIRKGWVEQHPIYGKRS